MNSGIPSKDGGLRITSKDCPEVRLLSSMTSMSDMTHQVRSTVSTKQKGEKAEESVCQEAVKLVMGRIMSRPQGKLQGNLYLSGDLKFLLQH